MAPTLALWSLVLVLGILGAGTAASEPIAVEYFAGRSTFKKGTLGTDVLRFELFSDSSCTTLLDSENLLVTDTFVHYYVDKQQRVRGGPKPPKAIRIQAVIDGPTTSTAPYLRVTGPGITAIGGPCQLQASGPVAGGPQGPQGDPGPMGPQGGPGPQGTQGPSGADGTSGPSGATGPPGPQGNPGTDGAPGPAGPPGPTGPDGAAGPAGPAGPTGAQGPTGADGAAGPAGPTGSQGPAGADGAAGSAGPTGAQGPTGADGVAGPAGPTGSQGPTGADGAAGSAGPTGAHGPTGADGVAGPAGPTGADGAAGPAGPTGPAGADGATGPTGPQGASGTSGSLIGCNNGNVADNMFLIPWDITENATESNADVPVSSGTASKLVVAVSDPLEAGESITIVIRRNGANTALTCTINALASTCSDLVNSEVFNDGDLLSIRYDEVGGPTEVVKYSFLYQAP